MGVFIAPRVEAQPAPITVAEESAFAETGRYDDVVAFMRALDEQSDLLHLSSLGESFEQRDLPLAIIADPPVRSAQVARADERMMVLLFGNIHAGEVCGKEALQMLARELVQTPEHPLLENLIIAIVPIYNADGNEHFSPDNRPGQVGPREMGQRPNAQGFDLNRDWIKLEAPETRAMVRFFNEWDPLIIIDTHTTNGSLHRYTVTHQGPLHPAGDSRLVDFVRDQMLPTVSSDLFERTGYRAATYGNFNREHTFWFSHPGQPRFGCAYRGLRNRIGILSEAYSYASYEDRIRGTLEFCRSILTYASEHKHEIEDLVRRIDERTIERGVRPQRFDHIPVRHNVRSFPEKVTILGYDEIQERGQRPKPGEPRDYEIDFVNDFYGTRFVPRPFAYVVPAELGPIIDKLDQHGIVMHRLSRDFNVLAEGYRIDQVDRAEREFQGHFNVSLEASRETERQLTLSAGSLVVLTAQPLGSLACYLLEPEADDGLVAWNFFDDHLIEGQRFPIWRVPHANELPLEAIKP